MSLQDSKRDTRIQAGEIVRMGGRFVRIDSVRQGANERLYISVTHVGACKNSTECSLSNGHDGTCVDEQLKVSAVTQR